MNAPNTTRPITTSRFGYPFKDKQGREIADPQAFFEALIAVQGGHYLLGRHGFFHGGIHLDRASSATLDLNSGIRCLADGEVVAYRINQNYNDATPGTPADGPVLRPYSTGLVLVRHTVQAPAPPQPPKPAPMAHPAADPHNLGTALYADAEGRQRLAWLRHGTPVTVELGKQRPGQSLVRVVEPREGWIKRVCLALDPGTGEGLHTFLGLKDRVPTSVHRGDEADPDKMANYAHNKAEQQRPAPSPAPTLTVYSLYMHVAAHADYAKHPKWARPAWWRGKPRYRVGSKPRNRQRTGGRGKGDTGLNIREQPSGRSPILGLLPRNACIEVGEVSENGKWARIARVTEGAIAAPVVGESVLVAASRGWVFLPELDSETVPDTFDTVVTLDAPHPIKQGEVVGYLGEDVPAGASPIANQPLSRRLLHLEVFSGDDVPAYLAASRQWAKQWLDDKQRTLLMLRAGDTLHSQPNGAVAFTLNRQQVLPLSGLEAKELDGVRWRKVVKLSTDQPGEASGWVKEDGHLASPWEWPGFEVHDETAAAGGFIHEAVDAFARYIRREGPRPPDSPFYQKLRAWLDRNRDGTVDETELDAVLRHRGLAGMISRLIVRHESEWSRAYLQEQRSIVERMAAYLGPYAQGLTLCNKSERAVLSFQIDGSTKLASVCEGANGAYLVYRFGGPKKIELQYPGNQDGESWGKFEYSGYSRNGGIQNDAMGDYALKFINAGIEYTVFQSWRLVGNDYGIGIIVETPRARMLLKGVRQSQVGALTLLQENPNIKNAWGE